MTRSPLFALAAMALIFLLGSCSEEVTRIDQHIYAPDSLSATVNDSIHFWSTYSGDPAQVARHLWDFNSDGIFDFEWTNFGQDRDTLHILHSYSQAGNYAATLQITTVDNTLFRTVTPVSISNETPRLEAIVPDSVGCADLVEMVGMAWDDGGRRAFWDTNGDGTSNVTVDFRDSVVVEAEARFHEPGLYTVSFGASDDDGNVERLYMDVTVGVPPQWSVGVPMSVLRTGHAAAEHGGKIYVFGGRNRTGTMGSVEIYDPGSASWTGGADLPTARWGLAAVTVGDLIYLIGGITGGGGPFPFLEIYDPNADSWVASTPDTMPILKQGFSALAMGSPQQGQTEILVFGGLTDGLPSREGLIYSIGSNSWRVQDTDNDTHFMIQPRAWMGAVSFWDNPGQSSGKFFAIGGAQDGANPLGSVESFDHFNPNTTRWHREIDCPTPRIVPAAAYHNGKIYVFGGALSAAGASDELEIYHRLQDRWIEGPAMLLARAGAAAVALDDEIYVIGGGTEASSAYNVDGSSDLQILRPWLCE